MWKNIKDIYWMLTFIFKNEITHTTLLDDGWFQVQNGSYRRPDSSKGFKIDLDNTSYGNGKLNYTMDVEVEEDVVLKFDINTRYEKYKVLQSLEDYLR